MLCGFKATPILRILTPLTFHPLVVIWVRRRGTTFREIWKSKQLRWILFTFLLLKSICFAHFPVVIDSGIEHFFLAPKSALIKRWQSQNRIWIEMDINQFKKQQSIYGNFNRFEIDALIENIVVLFYKLWNRAWNCIILIVNKNLWNEDFW